MIVQLKIGPSAAPAARDAMGLLLECHDRIRRHCALALRIIEAKDVPAEQVADAARQVVRYFGTALPLHVEDEDESLAPRLQQRVGNEVDHARRVAEMMDQHEQIELLLGNLIPGWTKLGESPSQPELIASLAEDTRSLNDAMEVHLKMEEEHLFPLAKRVLTPEELDALGAEIRQRRS